MSLQNFTQLLEGRIPVRYVVEYIYSLAEEDISDSMKYIFNECLYRKIELN